MIFIFIYVFYSDIGGTDGETKSLCKNDKIKKITQTFESLEDFTNFAIFFQTLREL